MEEKMKKHKRRGAKSRNRAARAVREEKIFRERTVPDKKKKKSKESARKWRHLRSDTHDSDRLFVLSGIICTYDRRKKRRAADREWQ